MSSIAVDLLCKNESDYIEPCIKALLPFVDKIFILDSGSTDNTINIIQRIRKEIKHKIRLNDFKWNGNYSDAHNYNIKFMQSDNQSYDYYLRVDADEIYFQSQLATLQEQLENYPEQIAWNMPYINFHGGHKCFDKYDKKPNLCKLSNLNIEYRGSIHEFIYINDKFIGNYANRDLYGNFFCHYSWTIIGRRYYKKLERIKSEQIIDNYNNTPTQKEAIYKFYKQFENCMDWQMKGSFLGPFPEVLQGSRLLDDEKYSVDNTMDSACVKKDEYCEHQCIIDKNEISCADYNYRKINCLNV